VQLIWLALASVFAQDTDPPIDVGESPTDPAEQAAEQSEQVADVLAALREHFETEHAGEGKTTEELCVESGRCDEAEAATPTEAAPPTEAEAEAAPPTEAATDAEIDTAGASG